MGGCCPGSDEDEAKKRFGVVGLVCLAMLMVGLALTWLTASINAQKRQADREQRLNSTHHENLPVHRGDLDRG